MQTTENIGLYLEDEDTTKFLDWRNKIAGVNDSNMQKIDAEFGRKADKSKTFSFTLSPAGWTGDSAPYTQEVTLTGLGIDAGADGSELNGIIGLARGASQEELDAAADAQLDVAAQSEGSITISARGTKPAIAIPVSLIILY